MRLYKLSTTYGDDQYYNNRETAINAFIGEVEDMADGADDEEETEELQEYMDKDKVSIELEREGFVEIAPYYYRDDPLLLVVIDVIEG